MKTYIPRLRGLVGKTLDYASQRAIFLNDRYGASHFLLPVLNGHETGFFTNGDDPMLQKAWARENGLKEETSLEDILLTQIEAHKAEVFYNLDPVRFPTSFVRRLPQSVKLKIAWSASPSGAADFTGYNRLLCNFPSLIAEHEARGLACAYFTPSHDPVMDDYAKQIDRPVDILFVGGYSQYHRNRAVILEAVADLGKSFRVDFHVYRSRLTKLADTPLGLAGPLKQYRTPRRVLRIIRGPIFGRAYYEALSRAKVILNIATEIAGEYRGNMRCWEAMGARGVLLTDTGIYPEGMDASTMRTYKGADAAVSTIRNLLDNPSEAASLAARGYAMVRQRYSKQQQWTAFQSLL